MVGKENEVMIDSRREIQEREMIRDLRFAMVIGWEYWPQKSKAESRGG